MAKRNSSGARSVAVKPRPRKLIKQRTAQRSDTADTSLYAVHPGIAMIQKWIGDLKAKTGRSLDEWLNLIKAAGPPTEKDCRDWLMNAYQLGTNAAGWLADKAFANGKQSTDDTPQAYLS